MGKALQVMAAVKSGEHAGWDGEARIGSSESDILRASPLQARSWLVLGQLSVRNMDV